MSSGPGEANADADARWTCRNCGSRVTPDYVRVFAPEELEEEGKVRCCPRCTKIRRNGDVRKARSRGASYQEGDIADTDSSQA